jgi:predicted aldo/keto reductase-like oxidoreductase
MKYRKLGASDLHVSEISLGSWLTFGVGVATDNALACVSRAFELGINFIDTANVYGRGKAETFLGEALAGRKRDSYSYCVIKPYGVGAILAVRSTDIARAFEQARSAIAGALLRSSWRCDVRVVVAEPLGL